MPTQALTSESALQELFSIMRICKWENKPHSNTCFRDFHYFSPLLRIYLVSKELLPWDALANQLTTRKSSSSSFIELGRVIAETRKFFYLPSDVDDYLYHIWGLNCEKHYHFSLFSPHFSTSSPSYCISPTSMKAVGIYILTIFKTLFPHSSLYMPSKSWSETHMYQDCP